MIERLAWVTAREAHGLDEDEHIALDALRAAGAQVDVLDWDDPEAEWSTYQRAVLRSAWDYPNRMDEFMAWLEHVSTQTELVNPLPMLRWSLDKTYLAELAEAGVPITPTTFAPLGAEPGFPNGRFVVKPAVGAGSKDAASYDADQVGLATEHVERLHAIGKIVLVQPFLRSVEAEGEWPMVYFDGVFSHAASKRVALPHAGTVEELFATETNAPFTATPEQVRVADAAIEFVKARFGTPAYARIDLVRADDGTFCVLEVELVEPSLFLPYADSGAAVRLAEALLR